MRRFGGNPSEWPEFISNFRNRINGKVSFNDIMRIERLLSALEGEAKKSVESIGCEEIFYAKALKSLKRDFGNPLLVPHLIIKSIFDQPQIKPNDKIELRKYHQQVKITNTWLLSMGYENPILSYENLSKAVTRRPNYLRTQFFKAAQDCDLTDGTINLLTFENWLERRIKELFKQLVEIISIQEARTKQQHPPKENFKKKIYSNFMNASDDKKEGKEASEEPQKQDERKNGLTCWLCKEKHRLMDCHEFKMKPVKDRRNRQRKNL